MQNAYCSLSLMRDIFGLVLGVIQLAYADKDKAFKYINDYKREKYDRINLLVPKGKKDQIKAVATAQGKSLNQYILDCIEAAEE